MSDIKIRIFTMVKNGMMGFKLEVWEQKSK